VSLLIGILLFAALGGIASAIFAVVFLWVREVRSAVILPHFVSFATGALVGAALLALLPEAIAGAGNAGAGQIGLSMVAGLALFFIIEKVVLWWHAHGEQRAGPLHVSGALVLVGDSVHNALDGVLIAAAFLNNWSLGVLTTVAVAAHEVPHRVGDFAILVHAGYSRRRALLLNLATGIASVFGALIAYFALRGALFLLPYALAFAAAGFLYIALAGLVPDLHRRSTNPQAALMQIGLVAAGVVMIAVAERLANI
jgi:zinc and cadmium transporter